MNTPHEHGPSPLCKRVGRVLPLLDAVDLDPSSTAEAHEHLRTCAYCQAQRAAYRSLDAALRQRFGLSSVARRSTEEIMSYIADDASEHIPPRATPAKAKTQPVSAWTTRKPFIGGLGAVAACAALIALTFVLYGSRLGFGPGRQISGPPRYTFAGTVGSFASISMVSPSDGWALAQVLKTPQGSRSLHEVALYHHVGGTWLPTYVQTSQNFSTGGVSGFNGTISMDSASDGWADVHNFNQVSDLLHYANGTWSEVSGPEVYGVQAVSPTSVWAITGGQLGSGSGLVHYDGTAWAQVPLPSSTYGNSANVVNFSMHSNDTGWALVAVNDTTFEMLHYSGGAWTVHSMLTTGAGGNVSSFAMVSPTDGWALGQNLVTGPNGTTAHVPLQQAIYHYANGHWSPAVLLANGGQYTTLEQITMLSARDGWIAGIQQNAYPGATVSDFKQVPVLFHYDGTHWNQVSLPQTSTPVEAATGWAFTADGSGWACGYAANIPSSQTVQDTDILANASPTLWSYANGTWKLYQQ